MSFVGTRPEVTKYVKKYTKEMAYAWIRVLVVIIITHPSGTVVTVCRKIQNSFWLIMKMCHRI